MSQSDVVVKYDTSCDFFPACLWSLRHGRQKNSECQMHFLLSVGLLRIQILDSAQIVVPSRCHRTELRRRHDGRQPSCFLHNVFVWRKMSDDIYDHSKQKRSPHDGTRLPHDGLTMGQIGIRYQHELLFRNTIGNFFDMPKIFRPITMLLTKPDKLSQRSYDGTKCPQEWRDIVRIRTEFKFVLIRVSILCQYRDGLTHAKLTFQHVPYIKS